MMSSPQRGKMKMFFRRLTSDLSRVDEILEELGAEMGLQEDSVGDDEELLLFAL